MEAVILDTSTLSEIRMQRHREVVRRANQYLRSRNLFQFSAITRYEVRRGYHWNQAWDALRNFDEFCSHCVVLPVTSEILDRTAELWGEARTLGQSAADADLIIAATAIVHGQRLVTSNIRHFEWIKGLMLADWRVA